MTRILPTLEAKPNFLHFAAEYPVSAHQIVNEFTDFDFLIALIAMRDSKYRELFRGDSKSSSRYRIVDSGIFEDPNNPISVESHVKTALNLEADELVAVDLINDCDGTLREMDKLLKLSGEFPFKIQGVVQGRTLTEWLHCYEEFEANPRVDVIGLAYFDVPKDLSEIGMSEFDVPDKAEAARLTLLHMIAGGIGVEYIKETEVRHNHNDVWEEDWSRFEFRHRGPVKKPIHILGLRHLRALKYYRNFPFVRSIDTSFPVQLGVEGRPLHLDSVKPAFKVNFSTELIQAAKLLIAGNVMRFVTLCCGVDETAQWESVDRLISS